MILRKVVRQRMADLSAMPEQGLDDVTAGARTVRHLYDYICELKSHASELESSIGPVDRGYFVADEDDATRGLMVSYWQTRNALLELVNSYRQRIGQDFSAATYDQFLIPYAAALVLVDTARFLRSLADERPVVRRKLNEPATEFGVPGGTYDAIQKSLVSSRNAWHLSRATRYFDLRRDQVQSFAGENDLDDLFEIAASLRLSVDVSKAQYAKAKFATRIDQLLRWFGRNAFVQSGYAIQTLAAGMMADVYVRRGHIPKVPDSIAEKLAADVLQPGDVIAVRKEFAVTNYFLPGYWPHVAMVIGGEAECSAIQDSTSGRSDIDASVHAISHWKNISATEPTPSVIESMKDGVHVRPVSSPLGSDSFVVLRPQLGKAEIDEAIRRGLRHVGKPYDFNFDFGRSDRLVCTEVVYRSMEGVGPIRFPLVQRMGRPTLSGLDLIRMSLQRQFFNPIAVYVPDESPEIQRHGSIDEIIRRKTAE